MCDTGNQTWWEGIKEGKFLVMARMVRYDHGARRYEFEDPVSSQWGAETIYVLADAGDFKGVA